ncbi:MAG: hypothetical protein ACYTEZ_05285 [Planctomycetota bacterium]|jgi:hypothetical protein
MQRMLVGLVVFLTAAVGVLAIATYNLSSEVDSLRQARTFEGGTVRRPVEPSPDAARISTLEERLARLTREVERAGRPAAATPPLAAREPVPPSTGEAPRPRAEVDSALSASERPRDAEGRFVLTEQDEELFLALQQRAERRRRIDATTRNIMRRLDRMATKGDIQVLQDREKVEAVLKNYITAGDDLVTRYLRQPPADIKALDPQERREQLGAERDRLVEQAQLDLEPLLGQQDAAAVAEASLQNPWGRRLGGSRRNVPGRLRRG